MPTYYNSAKHPLNNTVVRPYRFISASSTESTSNAIDIDDVYVPASPNFPPSESGASTSYFIYLDLDIYKTSTNSTEFAVYNVTQGRALTIVDPAIGLSNYTCHFYSTTSEQRNVLEVHVGSTSNAASDQLSLSGIFSASVITSTEQTKLSQIEYYNKLGSTASTSSTDFSLDDIYRVNEIVFELGAWDMANNQYFYINILGISTKIDLSLVVDYRVIIRDDLLGEYYLNLESLGGVTGYMNGGISSWGTNGEIALVRRTGGEYDTGAYNSTTINRGYMYLKYLTL